MASLSQGRKAAAQCGLFTHKSVPVIFEPPVQKVQPCCTEFTAVCAVVKPYVLPCCAVYIYIYMCVCVCVFKAGHN